MRREARVHPRKYAVVSLAEGCVAEETSAPLKKTHDTVSNPDAMYVLTPCTSAPPPLTRRTPRSK